MDKWWNATTITTTIAHFNEAHLHIDACGHISFNEFGIVWSIVMAYLIINVIWNLEHLFAHFNHYRMQTKWQIKWLIIKIFLKKARWNAICFTILYRCQYSSTLFDALFHLRAKWDRFASFVFKSRSSDRTYQRVTEQHMYGVTQVYEVWGYAGHYLNSKNRLVQLYFDYDTDCYHTNWQD